MGVNQTSVKFNSGFAHGDRNELELRPNPFHGTMSGSMADEIVITITHKIDDADDPKGGELHMTVKISELLNGIDLVKQSYFEEPQRECCEGCGRP